MTYSVAIQAENEGQVRRHVICRSGKVVTYREVIERWQNDDAFCRFFSETLANSQFSAFRWETPSVSQLTADQPFEFVLLNTPQFARRRTSRREFREHFESTSSSQFVVAFRNLSKSSMLIVPTPHGDDSIYGHLAAFVRGAPETQVSKFWNELGRQSANVLTSEEKWISTAGGGVAWLHARIDPTPKYYSYAPYRRKRTQRTE